MVPFGKRPKTLPTVLSRQEVDQLIECTPNLKHHAFLMTPYSGGLRFAEVANLRIHDIDSKRMQIRVACGKGKKEQLVPLSPRLFNEFRIYWSKYKPTGLLFPGETPEKTYADTTIRKAMKDTAMGEIFSDWYDWYLKSGIESAREPSPAPERPPAIQLSLPGLEEAGIATNDAF